MENLRLCLPACQHSCTVLTGSCLHHAVGVTRTEAQDLLRASLLQLCIPASKAAASSDGDMTSAVAVSTEVPVRLTPDTVASLAASFTGTLLQHYTLWSYVFTQEQQHVQHQHHLMVSPAGSQAPQPHSLCSCLNSESQTQRHTVPLLHYSPGYTLLTCLPENQQAVRDSVSFHYFNDSQVMQV